jgi:hypothetical protein
LPLGDKENGVANYKKGFSFGWKNDPKLSYFKKMFL